MAYGKKKLSISERMMRDRKKRSSSSAVNNVLKRAEQEKRDIKFFEENIMILNEKYEDFFSGKNAREPKALRREMDDLIIKYRKSPFVRTMFKFKFGNLVSKYNTYRAKWDKKLREIRRKEETYSSTSKEMSKEEKEYLNKYLDKI
jgi:hypothetical protein